MRTKEPGIIRTSFLNVLCVLPETSELEVLIAYAILSPRVCAVIGNIVWDIATINIHVVGEGIMYKCWKTDDLGKPNGIFGVGCQETL